MITDILLTIEALVDYITDSLSNLIDRGYHIVFRRKIMRDIKLFVDDIVWGRTYSYRNIEQQFSIKDIKEINRLVYQHLLEHPETRAFVKQYYNYCFDWVTSPELQTEFAMYVSLTTEPSESQPESVLDNTMIFYAAINNHHLTCSEIKYFANLLSDTELNRVYRTTLSFFAKFNLSLYVNIQLYNVVIQAFNMRYTDD